VKRLSEFYEVCLGTNLSYTFGGARLSAFEEIKGRVLKSTETYVRWLKNFKKWELVLHCHMRPSVAPVDLGFNYETHNAPACQI